MKPKILLFDIETMANLGWIWGKYEQNVIDYEQEWFVLCFAYKWLDTNAVKTVGLPDFKTYKSKKPNDLDVVKAMWQLFDEADIVIAHNGDQFDVKKMNARFVYHKLPPPSPYKQIDTKKVAKRHFNFNSNKLDDLGRYLGIGRKLPHTGWDLWKRCYEGDKTAWGLMLRYNKQDVLLLEEVYLRLRPYMTNHPDYNVFTTSKQRKENGALCPNCGSNEFFNRGIERRLKYNLKKVSCKHCGKCFYGERLAK